MNHGDPGGARVAVATTAWAVLTIAGTAVAAWAVPDIVSTGACSSTGQISGGNRDVAVCTDEQVTSIIAGISGIAVFFLGFLCTFRFIRGRDALVSRLVGGGIAALVVGGLAELKLREDDVIASMTAADLDGWRIGMLPLLIGGPVCLIVAVTILLVRGPRSKADTSRNRERHFEGPPPTLRQLTTRGEDDR